MERAREFAVRAVVVASTVGFLVALAWYLPKPGFTYIRLAFFLVLAGLAVLGTIGVLRHEPGLAVAGSVGLVLLGFWQATLWVYVVPVAVVLLVGGLVAKRESARVDD